MFYSQSLFWGGNLFLLKNEIKKPSGIWQSDQGSTHDVEKYWIWGSNGQWSITPPLVFPATVSPYIAKASLPRHCHCDLKSSTCVNTSKLFCLPNQLRTIHSRLSKRHTDISMCWWIFFVVGDITSVEGVRGEPFQSFYISVFAVFQSEKSQNMLIWFDYISPSRRYVFALVEVICFETLLLLLLLLLQLPLLYQTKQNKQVPIKSK